MDAMTRQNEAVSVAILPTSRAPTTLCSSEGFHFMKLPTEIRLLIYRDLLVWHGELGLSFCARKHRKSHRHTPQSLIHPAILRTCKQIYNEGLRVLYTDNTFELLCTFAIWQHDAKDLWHVGFGDFPLIPYPSPYVSTYIKRVSLTYYGLWLSRAETARFPQTWAKIEREVLQLCPNIESVFFRTFLRGSLSICVKLVRRHQRGRVARERLQSYKALLENFALRKEQDIEGYYKTWDILRDLCSAIWVGEVLGKVSKTAFAVQVIRWSKQSGDIHPDWEEYDRDEILMGCERDLVSHDENINGGRKTTVPRVANRGIKKRVVRRGYPAWQLRKYNLRSLKGPPTR